MMIPNIDTSDTITRPILGPLSRVSILAEVSRQLAAKLLTLPDTLDPVAFPLADGKSVIDALAWRLIDRLLMAMECRDSGLQSRLVREVQSHSLAYLADGEIEELEKQIRPSGI